MELKTRTPKVPNAFLHSARESHAECLVKCIRRHKGRITLEPRGIRVSPDRIAEEFFQRIMHLYPYVVAELEKHCPGCGSRYVEHPGGVSLCHDCGRTMIVTLPEGEAPDTFFKEHAHEWLKLTDGPKA